MNEFMNESPYLFTFLCLTFGITSVNVIFHYVVNLLTRVSNNIMICIRGYEGKKETINTGKMVSKFPNGWPEPPPIAGYTFTPGGRLQFLPNEEFIALNIKDLKDLSPGLLCQLNDICKVIEHKRLMKGEVVIEYQSVIIKDIILDIEKRGTDAT